MDIFRFVSILLTNISLIVIVTKEKLTAILLAGSFAMEKQCSSTAPQNNNFPVDLECLSKSTCIYGYCKEKSSLGFLQI